MQGGRAASSRKQSLLSREHTDPFFLAASANIAFFGNRIERSMGRFKVAGKIGDLHWRVHLRLQRNPVREGKGEGPQPGDGRVNVTVKTQRGEAACNTTRQERL